MSELEGKLAEGRLAQTGMAAATLVAAGEHAETIEMQSPEDQMQLQAQFI